MQKKSHLTTNVGLGHLAIQYSRKMGDKTVALSSSASKKELAEKLGAHIYLDGSKVDQAEELMKLGGAKVIMCTAPNGPIITKLLGGLAVNGTILLLAGEFLVCPTSYEDSEIRS